MQRLSPDSLASSCIGSSASWSVGGRGPIGDLHISGDGDGSSKTLASKQRSRPPSTDNSCPTVLSFNQQLTVQAVRDMPVLFGDLLCAGSVQHLVAAEAGSLGCQRPSLLACIWSQLDKPDLDVFWKTYINTHLLGEQTLKESSTLSCHLRWSEVISLALTQAGGRAKIP